MAGLVGLFGCPQLLDDNFLLGRLSEPDAGALCLDGECGVPHSGGFGGEAGQGGNAGGEGGGTAGSGNSGSSGAAGVAGSSGAAGSAGAAGTGNGADAGGGAGQGGTAGSGALAACRTFELNDTTQDSSSNCVGISGWNNVTTDTGTTLSLSYENGDPCFSGTISAASSGWGAVYDFTFGQNNATWNASTAGVTGFEFASRGANPPASLKVLYKDPGGVDFCRNITPGDTLVPFSDAHANCSTSASAPIVDTTRMVEIILAFLPGASQPYSVDFCLQITALD